jgi:catechol 2,3-dioxygenase-like lactoylglutathione lyase family enzyme
MPQHIGYLALVVRDCDEAIAWYCNVLGFTLVEDTPIEGKRWVLVAPPGSKETRLLLARAATPEQEKFIGRQSGGRVFLFLHTDDFWRDYRSLRAKKPTAPSPSLKTSTETCGTSCSLRPDSLSRNEHTASVSGHHPCPFHAAP